MILLIDNYDSFVHNLARYFQRLGQSVAVRRNDAVDVAEIRRLKPQAVVISPGPCTPTEAGSSVDVVRELWRDMPILGVCLGHQVIAEALGGKIVRAPWPMHGRTSRVRHSGGQIFQNIPSPITVCRYHSLVADESSLPAELQVTARSDDGVVMGIEHRSAPLFGLQFHPEAILTEHGYEMLANFLRIAGADPVPRVPSRVEEFDEPPSRSPPLPSEPITF